MGFGRSAVESLVTMTSCRFCSEPLRRSLVDLGMAPLSNAYLAPEELENAEAFYPLHARVCESCLLVQLPEFTSPEQIFGHYAYFSSYSDSWLEHARRYVDAMIERFGYDQGSAVMEVASNDGYLLQYFKARGVPVMGIEPARNVAAVAQAAGIPTLVKFLGVGTAREMRSQGHGADLLIGNNVLAHVPNINDFVGGLKVLLNPGGVLTMEFQHLMRLMERNQFDTIYHEHFSYLSLLTAEKIFSAHGLSVFDVQELSTHGGSLRVFACHADETTHELSPRVAQLRDAELAFGLANIETYDAFGERVRETKFALLEFLIEARRQGKSVVGYGAPAKGNTLLNYCGIRDDLLAYTVDRSPHKQGFFLPGTHIPIYAPEKIAETKPDYLLILAWNLKDEIMAQMAQIRSWGGRFAIPIPHLEVIE
jgi:SAM-dependent methyltransferase